RVLGLVRSQPLDKVTENTLESLKGHTNLQRRMSSVDCMSGVVEGRSKAFSQRCSAEPMRDKKVIQCTQRLSGHTGLSRRRVELLNLLILGRQFAVSNLALFP